MSTGTNLTKSTPGSLGSFENTGTYTNPPTDTEQLTFLQRFTNNKQVKHLINNMKKSGELIYKPSDILETIHPLNKLIRMFFVDQFITDKYLEDMHYVYCSSQGDSPEKINSDRNNFRKNLAKPEPTFLFFEKTFAIFGSVIIDIGATMILPDNSIVVYQKTNYNYHTNYPIITVNDISKMKLPQQGTPIFLPQDVYKTTHPISLFIHMFVIHQGITLEDFYTKHYEYYEKLGYTPNKINANRNNSIKRYFKEKPTFRAWESFNTVMDALLFDFTIIVKHRDGNIVTYRLSDAKKIANLYTKE